MPPREPQFLGQASEMVGRDRELADLTATFDQCVSEPVTRCTVVTGEAGFGKTRLCAEFADRVRARLDGPIPVWVGRGDPMRMGSPFALFSGALKNGLGVWDSDPPGRRRLQIEDHVARGVPSLDQVRVAEFLGEITGTPFVDGSSQLRAARSDASLMRDHIQRACEDFLAAECARTPLLIVLEDLHWADVSSLTVMDAMLRNLRERPLMVLGSARPEVETRFPRFWSERGAEIIRLGALTRKSAERLVRRALGAKIEDSFVETLVRRAKGNAFHLEELLREVRSGRAEPLPKELSEIIQVRLESLDLDARRVLGAASIFGRSFRPGGVEALIQGVRPPRETLQLLSNQGIVSSADSSQLNEECDFHHALIQEHVYGTLSAQERQDGHRLAGEWLERMGETDAFVLAEHFERGGQPGRALQWFPRAARQSLEGNDLYGALERASRGAACGAQGEQLGELMVISAEARNWLGQNVEAVLLAVEAMSLLPPGSNSWFAASREGMISSLKAGDIDRLVGIAEKVRRVQPKTDAMDMRRTALAWAAMELALGGRYPSVVEILNELPAATVFGDPHTEALVTKARALWAVIEGRPEAIELLASALTSFAAAGDLRNLSSTRADLAFVLMGIGAWADADRMLRQSLAEAERLGLRTVIPQIKHNLGFAMMGAHANLVEAAAVEAEAVEEARLEGAPRFEGIARTYLALIHLRSGSLHECEIEAVKAAELLKVSPGSRAMTLAILALGRLAAGRVVEAHAAAREGIELLRSLGNLEEGESLVRVAYAETLRASGDLAGSNAAILEAREMLLERAARLTDPSRKESFLNRIVENARTLALAAEWTGS